MPTLSWTESHGAVPIAKVISDDSKNGAVLWLKADSDGSKSSSSKHLFKTKPDDFQRGRAGRAVGVKLVARLQAAANTGDLSGLDDREADLASTVRKRYLATRDKSVSINNGRFQLLPNLDPNQRQVIFCCGAGGAGKSIFARDFIKVHKKQYPGSKVFIVSQLDFDPSLECKQFELIQVPLDEAFMKERKLAEFEGLPNQRNLIIFDGMCVCVLRVVCV